MNYLNADTPLNFVQGDTGLSPAISEANWDLTNGSALFILENLFGGTAVSPFSGQSATITTNNSPATMRYDWPSALPAGRYRAYFQATDQNGRVLSTSPILITVDPA